MTVLKRFNNYPNYPLVFFPKSIEEYCQQNPCPTLEEPKLHEVIEKNAPAESRFHLNQVLPSFPVKKARDLTVKLGLVWIGWVVGVFAIIVLSVAAILPFLSGWSFALAYSLLFYLIYSQIRRQYFSLCRHYYQHLESYKLLALNYRYELAKQKAKIEQKTSTNPSEQIEQQKQVIQKRWRELRQLVDQRIKPLGISQARQGVSEQQFSLYLQSYFDQVVQGGEFKTNQKWNYSADFLVIHPPSGLGIELEIDEPYALLSKKPTHCLDQETEHRRNQFFVSGGWIVVRFTELQIVKAPLSCCKLIAEIIAVVTGDYTYQWQFKEIPNLLIQPPWTVKEARQMARENYRLSYLPHLSNIRDYNQRNKYFKQKQKRFFFKR